MVTINEIKNTKLKVDGEYIYCVLAGNSDDTKPVEVEGKKVDNGSFYLETDTGKVYLYDLENQQWNEVA